MVWCGAVDKLDDNDTIRYFRLQASKHDTRTIYGSRNSRWKDARGSPVWSEFSSSLNHQPFILQPETAFMVMAIRSRIKLLGLRPFSVMCDRYKKSTVIVFQFLSTELIRYMVTKYRSSSLDKNRGWSRCCTKINPDDGFTVLPTRQYPDYKSAWTKVLPLKPRTM